MRPRLPAPRSEFTKAGLVLVCLESFELWGRGGGVGTVIGISLTNQQLTTFRRQTPRSNFVQSVVETTGTTEYTAALGYIISHPLS